MKRSKPTERFTRSKQSITVAPYYTGIATLYTHKDSAVIIMCPDQKTLQDVLANGLSSRAFDPAKFITAVIASKP
jgi:hypothetical protein